MKDPSQNSGELPPREKRALLKRLLREKAAQPREAPLSFGQERLWFLDQLAPANAAYCETVSGRMAADVSPRTLNRALNEVVRRHEILRTTFGAVNGKPVQRIAAELRLTAPVIDLSALKGDARARELSKAIAAQSWRPFDLVHGPLLRLTLIRLDRSDHVVVLTFHHIVGDAWSVGVFLRELFVAYVAFSTGSGSLLPEPTIQYSDFARWQRKQLEGGNLASQIAHLKERLADLPTLELPTDRPRQAVRSFRGATHSFELSEEFVGELERTGREEGATLFMTILMAFQLVLSRYTEGEDIVVGSPVAGRNRAELEGLIGCFVNMVLLRTSFRDDPTLRELVRRVRQVCLDAYAHQDVPFERLVEELRPDRNLSHEPLFQVAFAHHKDLLDGPAVPGIDYEPVPIERQTSKFDLSLYTWNVRRDQRLMGSIEYSTDLFDTATIVRMMEHFKAVLRSIASDPDKHLSELSLLREHERQQLLFDSNQDYTHDPPGSLLDTIERQAEKAPDSVAAVFEGEHLSYGELNRRSNQLAHHLRSLGVEPDVRVGLLMERSLSMVVGLLGILKSGGAYVPLDPIYPDERIRFMLNDSGAKVFVTHAALADLSIADAKHVVLHEDWRALGEESENNPPRDATAANLAYVIYTSGSTGTPKGVAVTHANVARLFEATLERFDFSDADTWTLFHSHAFDFSVWELLGALLYGGRLVVVPHRVARSPGAFYELLARERVTVLNQTPSAFGQLLKVEEEASSLPTLALRLVIFGGEALDQKSLEPWFGRHGDENPRLVNMYGITETTVHVTYRTVSADDLAGGAVNVIGRALPDLRLYVFDRRMQPAPIGVPGEIYVGGAGLARGYLDRPDLTAERFLPDPYGPVGGGRLYRTGDRARFLAVGELQYLGRTDHQVKIRGFRIELGEIESVLTEHPAVRQAVVVVQDEPVKRLVAYVVVDPRLVPELRGLVSDKLPGYMMPSAFVPLRALPLNTHGKVDRNALPAPAGTRPELGEDYVAPRSEVEAELAAIWSEVLGTDQVGVHDDFFELGGHSLMATQLVSRVRETFQKELPLLELFEKRTIAALADVLISGAAATHAAQDIDPRHDVILDPVIRVADSVRHVDSPDHVLLTGGTGFLGAFLLHELLARTRANVYCLVRAANADEARKRIQATLESFSLGEDGTSARLVPIPGDLSAPLLGLSAARFDELAARLDVIYHNGAMVNAVYPYSIHKPTNVLGTHEVLRLASRIRGKPVHYVSTTGVVLSSSDSSNVTLEENELDDESRLPADGYSQSKWVAERIVLEARSRGLPVCIYRPGRITGHSQTGASNDGDLFSRILKTCIQLGQAPVLEASAMTDLVPADYVSRALVHLSMQEDSAGRVFHLVNPHPMEWRKLIDWIVEFGYPLKRVPLATWIENRNQLVREFEDQVSAALDLSSVPQLNGSLLQFPQFDSRNTLDALEGSSIVCPPVDDRLFSTYFSYWIQNGFLPPPTSDRGTTETAKGLRDTRR